MHKYVIGDRIGHGKFGTVHEAKCVNSTEKDERVAIKRVDRSFLHQLDVGGDQYIEREILLHLSLDHPHIVCLLDHYRDETSFYLVMELATGGDLHHFRLKRRGGKLKEKTVKHAMRQVLSAVAHCHGRDIIVRDVKPDNVLLVSGNTKKERVWKLTDFGYSIQTRDLCTDAVGTVDFVSPEIALGKPYGKDVDIWAIGVSIYELLTGNLPFSASTYSGTYKKWGGPSLFCRFANATSRIKACAPDYTFLSPDAVTLLSCIFVVEPAKRPVIEQLLKDPWICED